MNGAVVLVLVDVRAGTMLFVILDHFFKVLERIFALRLLRLLQTP